jgi:spore coat polysaccharide biosynthesis protein SpsF
VYQSVPGLDYLSTSITRCLPLGLDVEIVGANALRTVDRIAAQYHRTHVTSYVYTHPESFRIIGLTLPPDTSHLRLTLDTEADWNMVTAVVEHFGEGTVSVRKLSDWLAANPNIRAINAEIQQKALDQG